MKGGQCMAKEIYICIDGFSARNFAKEGIGMCYTYDGTEREIEFGVNKIATTSLAHLTFDVINKGYDMYLCYKDNMVKVEEGMQLSDSGYCLSEPSCCDDCDILECFKSGYFDKMLGYDTRK